MLEYFIFKFKIKLYKLGVGCSAMIVPIYLAELSPNSIRGGMVSFNTVFITLGFNY